MEEYDYLFKILLIGNPSVGKSSIFTQFIETNYSDLSMSTIGIDFKIKTIKVDNKYIKLQIWDTAGQDRFKTLTNSYYRGSHGIIIVFDITNRKSFIDLQNWLNDIYRYSENTYKIIVGNKLDLDDQRKIHYKEAKEFADSLGLIYIEISAKDNINVDYIFELLSKELTKNMSKRILPYISTIKITDDYILLKDEKKNKTNFCCK